MCESDPLNLPTLDQTLQAGRALGRALVASAKTPVVIYLWGDLGAGKTTLARGLLAGMGHRGRVPSPTYTLIEPYEFPAQRCFHVDLYRLVDPAEVLELALAELLEPGTILVIEWPERAGGQLPAADLEFTLHIVGTGRDLHVRALTSVGQAVLEMARRDVDVCG